MKESTWEDFPVKAWGTSKTPTYTVIVQYLQNVKRAMPDLDAVAESFQAGKFVIDHVLGLRAMPPVGPRGPKLLELTNKGVSAKFILLSYLGWGF